MGGPGCRFLFCVHYWLKAIQLTSGPGCCVYYWPEVIQLTSGPGFGFHILCLSVA